MHPHVAPGWDWVGKGNEERDRFTNGGAEEGLPEGELCNKVTAVRMVPRADLAEKTQRDPT